MQYTTKRQMARNGAVNTFTGALAASSGQFVPFMQGSVVTISTTSTSSTARSAAFQHEADDKIGFFLSWCNTVATTGSISVVVSAGSEGRAWNRDQGAYTFYPSGSATGSSGANTGKRWILGPFESARFAVKSTSTQWSGRNEVRMTIVTTSAGVRHNNRVGIVPFKMPVVSYSS